MKKFRNILWGIVLIALGLIIGVNTLGLTNIDVFFDGWWTLLIIIPCFIGLFDEKERTGNLIGLIVGVVLLFACRGLIDFEIIFKLFVPVLLVALGISLIFKDAIKGKVKSEIKKEINKINEKKKQSIEYNSIFAAQDIRFDGEVFNGAELTAVFGGMQCDLTKAIIEEDIVINANAIFGGIDILVPNNVKVKVKSSSLFGGVSDKKVHSEEQESKTIYINATCVFGGVDIK